MNAPSKAETKTKEKEIWDAENETTTRNANDDTTLAKDESRVKRSETEKTPTATTPTRIESAGNESKRRKSTKRHRGLLDGCKEAERARRNQSLNEMPQVDRNAEAQNCKSQV